MDVLEVPTTWADQLLNDKLGIVVHEASIDRLVGTMPVEGNRQAFGLLHGGANGVMIEHLGSYGAALLAQSLGKIASGLELSATHIRGASEGLVTGLATPVHKGGSTAAYQVTITDEQGRIVSFGKLICILRDPKPTAP